MSDSKIKEIEITKDVFLFFEPTENGKYTFSSNSPKLQDWANKTKTQKVKEEAIKHVVNAAKVFMGVKSAATQKQNGLPAGTRSQQPKEKAAQDPRSYDWSGDPVSTLNIYCQRSGLEMPKYKTVGVIQDAGNTLVSVKMTTHDGRKITQSAASAKKAKRLAVTQYCKEAFGLDIEKMRADYEQRQAEENQRIEEAFLAEHYSEESTNEIENEAKKMAEIEKQRPNIIKYFDDQGIDLNKISYDLYPEEGDSVYDFIGEISTKFKMEIDSLDLIDIISDERERREKERKALKSPSAENKLNLLRAAENEEHIKRHTMVDSLTIGSKSTENNPKYIENLLKYFDNAYAKLIEEKGNPGRQVFAIECDRAVGTNAVVPIATLTDEAKNKIFKTSRDIGSQYENEIKAVLISEQDMPKTNLVHAVYGPYGPTGNAGIYTMLYGSEGRPFPRPLDGTEPLEVVAENNLNKEFWDNHVFLCTPKELQQNIAEMHENGQNTLLLQKRLDAFNRCPTSPLKEVYKPKISSNAIKIERNNQPFSPQRNIRD